MLVINSSFFNWELTGIKWVRLQADIPHFFLKIRKNETNEQEKSLDDSTGGKSCAIKNWKKKSVKAYSCRYQIQTQSSEFTNEEINKITFTVKLNTVNSRSNLLHPQMFSAGICPWCDTYYTCLIPFHERSAQKNSLYFTLLPKTITPPNASPPSQLQRNSSSAFEVFMDINDPTFQKSSTCLA